MRQRDYPSQAVQELLAEYVRVGIAQYEGEQDGDIPQFNRLVDTLIAVEVELKRRPSDQRRALVALYRSDPSRQSIQVRLNAAHATVALEPEAARKELKAIEASKRLPQALHAGMSLWNLDRGVWKPT